MSPTCKRIFEHLLRGGSISTLEAMRDFGCCRLSERIREIEATGIVIDRKAEKIGKKRFIRYSYHLTPPGVPAVGLAPITKKDIAWAHKELERLGH